MGVLADGSRREALDELRRHLAASIEVAEPKELPALARQMTAVLREIDALPVDSDESGVDEFTKRLSSRRSTSAASRSAGVGRQRRSGSG